MTNKNNNREVVIIHPNGTLEISFSPDPIDKKSACDMLKDMLPEKGKFSLYEWHNAHLEVGVRWRGVAAQAWSFISMASDGATGELPPNPLASDLRAISLGKHAAPVFGPVLIAVKQ